MTTTSNTQSDLEPCPFCASAARVCESIRYDDTKHVVECLGCHATPYYRYGKAEAIAAWNKRSAADVAPRVSLTDGWKLVPVEPTPEMLKAGRASYVMCLSDGDAGIQYRAMLAAAPLPPSPIAAPTDKDGA